MRRLAGVVAVALCAAAALATLSAAAPEGATAPSAGERGASAQATRLPPLPAQVRQNRRWRIGVKCDAPPFGYIDVRGRNAGFDVEIARWFSRPEAQYRHSPHVQPSHGTPSRSPVATSSPTIWWPGTSGSFGSGSSPSTT